MERDRDGGAVSEGMGKTPTHVTRTKAPTLQLIAKVRLTNISISCHEFSISFRGHAVGVEIDVCSVSIPVLGVRICAETTDNDLSVAA